MQPPNQRLTTALYNIRIGIALTAALATSAFVLGIVAIIIKETPTTDIDIDNDIFNNITQVISFSCTNDTSCVSFGEVFTCSTSFCNLENNRCEFELLPTSECQTSSDCMGTYICNQCQCISPIPPNVTVGCLMDSDCPNFNMTNECYNTFCDIETMACFSNFTSPGFDCSGDDSLCDGDEVCRDCQCVDLCSMVTCESDACQTSACDPKTGTCQVMSVEENCCTNTTSCPTQTWSECIQYECGMNNTCDQVLIPGNDCVVDDDCGEDEACSSCMCIPDPPMTQFSDEEFALTDGADDTTTGTFSLGGVTMGTNVQLDFPDVNGTIALLSNIPETFPTDTFRLFDDVDNTKQASFDVSAVATSTTVQIDIPNEDGTMILGNVPIDSSLVMSPSPVPGATFGYKLARIGSTVHLWYDGFAGTCSVSTTFNTGVFISADLRPPETANYPAVVISNGGNTLGLVLVTDSGSVTIFLNFAGASFPASGICGFRAFQVSWQV